MSCSLVLLLHTHSSDIYSSIGLISETVVDASGRTAETGATAEKTDADASKADKDFLMYFNIVTQC